MLIQRRRGGEENAGPAVASLMPRPRSVHDLWVEYQFGTGGRKPARSFTAEERGKVKSVYSFRRPLWEKVDELVRTGRSAHVACDMIYQAYGQDATVTAILRQMKKDRRTGWPPVLRVLYQ